MKRRDLLIAVLAAIAILALIAVPIVIRRNSAVRQITASPPPTSAPSKPSPIPTNGRTYRVGVIVSYRSANDIQWNGKPIGYTFEHVVRELNDTRVRLVAIIEPGTADKPGIREALATTFKSAPPVDLTNADELATLDAIVTGRTFIIEPAAIDALTAAVRDRGVGLLLWGDLGNHGPGLSDPRIAALHGMTQMQWGSTAEPSGVPCTVLASHPLLGDLRPGATLKVQAGNAYGVLAPGGVGLATVADPSQIGGHIVITPTPPFHTIYVSQLGRGRIVGVQIPAVRQIPPSLNRAVGGNFLLRCVTWLAEKQPTTISSTASTSTR